MVWRYATGGAALLAWTVLLAPDGIAEATYIAGVKPDGRPAGAPVITEHRDAAFRERALRGVSEPIPQGIDFLRDQGAWYTPFSYPGMTGRYDLRGLHARTRRQ
jgi:hypothetical protein